MTDAEPASSLISAQLQVIIGRQIRVIALTSFRCPFRHLVGDTNTLKYNIAAVTHRFDLPSHVLAKGRKRHIRFPISVPSSLQKGNVCTHPLTPFAVWTNLGEIAGRISPLDGRSEQES